MTSHEMMAAWICVWLIAWVGIEIVRFSRH